MIKHWTLLFFLIPALGYADNGYAGSMVDFFHANPFYALFGLALIVAEFILPTKGLLGVAGIALFALGTFSMANNAYPLFHLSWAQIILVNILVIGAALLIACKTFKDYNAGNPAITDALLNQEATVIEWDAKRKRVEIGGGVWQAESNMPHAFNKGDKVLVKSHDNLTLTIIPKGE